MAENFAWLVSLLADIVQILGFFSSSTDKQSKTKRQKRTARKFSLDARVRFDVSLKRTTKRD